MALVIERDGIVVCHSGGDLPMFMPEIILVCGETASWFVGDVTFCNGWHVMYRVWHHGL